jgi:hypothetical protein
VTFTERDFTKKDKALIGKWGARLEHLGHLHRYISLRDDERFGWFENVVLGSKLHFSSFKGFNDPFDGAVQLTYDGTEQEIRRFWAEHLDEIGQPLDAGMQAKIDWFVAGANEPKVHEALRAEHAKEVAKRGVLCMSEPPDHFPMWGYYADSHRGVCLRFHVWGLLGWKDCFPPIRMNYENEYPVVSFYRDSRFRRGQVTIATKAKVWKHEAEWRMISDALGYVSFPPEALAAVIMGSGIDPAVEKRVREVVSKRTPRIELLKAHLGDRKYRLDTLPA